MNDDFDLVSKFGSCRGKGYLTTLHSGQKNVLGVLPGLGGTGGILCSLSPAWLVPGLGWQEFIVFEPGLFRNQVGPGSDTSQ